jgi:flagellar hook-length control protein FliK
VIAKAGSRLAAVPTSQASPTREIVHPVGAATQVAVGSPGGLPATQPVQAAAPDILSSRMPTSVAGRDAISPDRESGSPTARQIPAAGLQATPSTASSGTPSQPAPASISGARGHEENLAPPNMTPPTTPAAIDGPAPPTTATQAAGPVQAPASDHKPTLRAAAANGDPAQPAALSGALPQQAVPSVTPTGEPAATSAAATSLTHATGPASPAEQIAPTLLTLAKATDGSQQMTVRLQPGELGMVQVKIARERSGATQIEITAENPTTLLALQRDQPQLHRTLDEAGIPATGRTVTYHVAEAAQAAANSNGSATSGGHTSSQPSSASRTNAGSTDADGSAGGGKGSYPARERNTYSTGRRSNSTPATTDANVAPAGKSYRVGLDITA